MTMTIARKPGPARRRPAATAVSTDRALLIAALAALSIGALVYALARSRQVWFLPAAVHAPMPVADALQVLVGSAPTFVHVLAFSLITVWSAPAFIAGIGNVRSIRMMLDASGAPVIAYWSGTLNVIRETAPDVWTPLGGAVNNEPTDFNGAAAFGVQVDVGGTVRVAWVKGISSSTGVGPWAIYARRFDGANWVSAAPQTNNTGFVYNADGNARRFPTSLVVARNPNVFAFATAWDMLATGDSQVRVHRVAGGLFAQNQVPTAATGQYRRARHVSLAMADADRVVVTSSHNEPTVTLPYLLHTRPYLLQLHRYFP